MTQRKKPGPKATSRGKVIQGLKRGWDYDRISEATGLSKGRISQIAKEEGLSRRTAPAVMHRVQYGPFDNGMVHTKCNRATSQENSTTDDAGTTCKRCLKNMANDQERRRRSALVHYKQEGSEYMACKAIGVMQSRQTDAKDKVTCPSCLDRIKAA